MAGGIGIQPLSLQISSGMQDQMGAFGGMRTGQSLAGIVQQAGDALVLEVAGTKIPISMESQGQSLLPGTPVRVEIAGTQNGIQLRVTPIQLPATAAGAATQGDAVSSPLTRLVQRVLDSMAATLAKTENAASVSSTLLPEAAIRLLPSSFTQSPATVRSILNLFINRGAVGQDLQRIVAFVNQAATQGILPADTANQLAALVQQHIAKTLEELPQQLHALSRQSLHSTESVISKALLELDVNSLKSQLTSDLREMLGALRDNTSLQRMMSRTAEGRISQNALDQVLDRLTGAQLQNMHALNHSYVYLEIPFLPNSPIQQAQVHFFSDKKGKRGTFDPENSSVVLDISTTKLGDLWIDVQVTQGICRCRFRATEPDVVEAITETGDELVSSLKSAGYSDASVSASLWNGDRLSESTYLFHRFSGFTITV